MTSDDHEAIVSRIRDEVTVLSGQLEALAADLRLLSDSLPEQASAGAREPSGQVVPASRRPAPVADPAPPEVADVPSPGPQQQSPTQEEPRRVSLPEFFAVAGAAVTLIGVALVLVLPTTEGALAGPIIRTTLGLALAGAAVAAAFWQHRADPGNIGARALLATGMVSTFLCVLALTTRFADADGAPLLPLPVGLVVAGLVTAGGLWTGRAWRSQGLAVLAVLGSLLLGPWMAAAQTGNTLAVVAFMSVVTLGAGVAQSGLGWAGLVLARTLPTALYFSWVGAPWPDSVPAALLPPAVPTTGAVLLAAFLALGSLVVAVVQRAGIERDPGAEAGAMAALTAPLVVVVWHPESAVAAGLTCLVVGAVFCATLAFPEHVTPDVRAAAIPLGLVFLGFGLVIAADLQFLGYVYWALAVAYLAIAERTRSGPALVVGSVLGGIGLVAWLPVLPAVFGTSLVERAGAEGFERVVQSLLGVGVVVSASRAYRTFFPDRRALALYLGWSGAVVLGAVAMVLTGSLVGWAGGDTTRGYVVAQLLVTTTLAALCIVLLRGGLGDRRERRARVRLAIGLAVAAVAKLFLFDTQALPGLWRALAFIAVGIVLLVVGTWYFRQLRRVTLPPSEQEPPGRNDRMTP